MSGGDAGLEVMTFDGWGEVDRHRRSYVSEGWRGIEKPGHPGVRGWTHLYVVRPNGVAAVTHRSRRSEGSVARPWTARYWFIRDGELELGFTRTYQDRHAAVQVCVRALDQTDAPRRQRRRRLGRCVSCSRLLTALERVDDKWRPAKEHADGSNCTGVSCAKKPKEYDMPTDVFVGDKKVPRFGLTETHLSDRVMRRADAPVLDAIYSLFLHRGGPVRRAWELAPEELEAFAAQRGMTVALVHGPVAPARCDHGRAAVVWSGDPSRRCRAVALPGRSYCPEHKPLT